MPIPKKKPIVGDAKQSDSCEMEEEKIEVDFEARVADDTDIPGITNLLIQVFPDGIHVNELAKYIVSHNNVGSVIKSVYEPMEDDDEDSDDDANQVYGITTVINISQSEETTSTSSTTCKSVDELRQLFVEKCGLQQADSKGSKEVATYLSQLFSATECGVGLVISERFLNIPPQIAPPLYRSLKSDMDTATQKGMRFKFNHYLIIAKTFQSTDPADTEITFGKAEEEIFAEEATHQFKYKVKHGEMANDFDTYNTVLMLTDLQFDKALEKIEQLLKQ